MNSDDHTAVDLLPVFGFGMHLRVGHRSQHDCIVGFTDQWWWWVDRGCRSVRHIDLLQQARRDPFLAVAADSVPLTEPPEALDVRILGAAVTRP
jgi:hypothetical protein